MQDDKQVLHVRTVPGERKRPSPRPGTVLDGLNLLDKFLFDETMDIPEAYNAAVEILLSRDVNLLNQSQTEKELRVSPQLRQIRLDVIGMDEAGNIYYTEMQKQNTHNLCKRSRYYMGQVDVSLLPPGCVDFNELNDVTMILVAPFDIFGYGLYRYTFEPRCREVPDLWMNDGATRIFINTHGTNREAFSQEFLDFMDYINSSTDETASHSTSSRIRLIHNHVSQIRSSEKMGVKYMQRWEEIALSHASGVEEGLAEGHASGLAEGHASGLAEGRSEGEQRKLAQLVCRKLRRGMEPEEIALALEEDPTVIRLICEALKDLAPDYKEAEIDQLSMKQIVPVG